MADPDMAEIMGLMQRHMHVISTFEQEAAQEAQQEPSRVNILMATFWHHTKRHMSHGATREEAYNLTVQSCSTEQLQDLRNALDNAAAEEAARDHAVHGIQPEDFMYQDSIYKHVYHVVFTWMTAYTYMSTHHYMVAPPQWEHE